MCDSQTCRPIYCGIPKIDVNEISPTLVDQTINGFEGESLLTEELIRIGSNTVAVQKPTS